MTYEVDVKDIDKATIANIHLGKTGKSGPVVVTIFKSATPTGHKSGVLAQGSITSDKRDSVTLIR